MKTKKQLLHRIRQISEKCLYDTDKMRELGHDTTNSIMMLDTTRIANEVYELLSEYEEQYGRLPQ